jgi:hypothetical protein
MHFGLGSKESNFLSKGQCIWYAGGTRLQKIAFALASICEAMVSLLCGLYLKSQRKCSTAASKVRNYVDKIILTKLLPKHSLPLGTSEVASVMPEFTSFSNSSIAPPTIYPSFSLDVLEDKKPATKKTPSIKRILPPRRL